MSTEIMEPVAKNSTHRVEIVPFAMEKHPNADTLSVVTIFGGYTCVVRSDDWKGFTKAAYLPPDSLVDVTRPEFAFLAKDSKDGKTARIKARRLRGISSFGCLVPAPEAANIGDDVAALLGVTHYEPAIKGEGGDPKQRLYMGGEVAKGPNVFTVKYDVDSLRRYHQLFKPDEKVIVTEKLDGANSRYVFIDGKMHCGSRTEWKREFADYSHITVEYLLNNGVPEERAKEIFEKIQNKPKRKNMWWEILERTPALERFCHDNPGVVVYGEAFGNVGRIKYGVPDGFAAFDIMRDGKWLDKPQTRDWLTLFEVPQVPLIAEVPYNFEHVCSLADGNTLVAGADPKAIREGCVVTPIVERRDPTIGRVQLKAVSVSYLEKY